MSDVLLLLEEQQYRFECIVEYFPIIKDLNGVEQNPEWHQEGDAFIHTRNVCRAVISLPEWNTLDQTEKGILYLAALFHDIGKKSCSRIENGSIVSPKHAIIGSRIFRELCYCEQFCIAAIPYPIRESICALIRFHGLPQHFMEKEPVDFYLFKARETTAFPLLHLLAKADILGRECDNKQEMLAVADYFKEYASELNCFKGKKAFASEYTRNRYFHGTTVWHGESLYDVTEFSVFLLSGLPLAGKDTFIARHFSDLPEISLDQIREEKGIRPDKGSSVIVAEARERAKDLLRQKQPFVWNATNIIADTRRKLCDLFEAYGARVHIIYVEEPYHVLMQRNQNRERYIPLPALEKMITKLEIPDPTEAYRVEYYINGKKVV